MKICESDFDWWKVKKLKIMMNERNCGNTLAPIEAASPDFFNREYSVQREIASEKAYVSNFF